MGQRSRRFLLVALGVLVIGRVAFAIWMDAVEADSRKATATLVGVVVGVQSQGLDRVTGFDLRTDDGVVVTFLIADLENAATFPPGHLVEHQATASPVKVWYRVESSINVAVRIEDAPAP